MNSELTHCKLCTKFVNISVIKSTVAVRLAAVTGPVLVFGWWQFTEQLSPPCCTAISSIHPGLRQTFTTSSENRWVPLGVYPHIQQNSCHHHAVQAFTTSSETDLSTIRCVSTHTTEQLSPPCCTAISSLHPGLRQAFTTSSENRLEYH